MGQGAKSSAVTSWTLSTVLVVGREKPLEKVFLHVYAKNLQHCSLDFPWIPSLYFLPFLA